MALWIRTKSGTLVNTDHVEAIEIVAERGQINLCLSSGKIVTFEMQGPEQMVEALKCIGDSMASTGQGLFDTSPFE